MKTILIVLLCLLITPPTPAGLSDYLPLTGDWKIKSGQIKIIISFVLHPAEGQTEKFEESYAQCQGDKCTIFVKARVDTFKTKDDKRDADLLKTVKAEQNPFVILSGEAMKKDNNTMVGQFTIELAGRKKEYKDIPIKIERDWNQLRSQSLFAIELRPFIDKLPSFLGLEIDDKLKIETSIIWEKNERAIK